MKDLPVAEMANGESKRSMQIMESADFPETVGEQVLIQGKGSIKSDILRSSPPSRTPCSASRASTASPTSTAR